MPCAPPSGEREPEVHVRVVEAGDHRAAADVDHLGAGAGGAARGGLIVAGVGDLAVDDRERRWRSAAPASGERVGVGEDHGQNGGEHARLLAAPEEGSSAPAEQLEREGERGEPQATTIAIGRAIAAQRRRRRS